MRRLWIVLTVVLAATGCGQGTTGSSPGAGPSSGPPATSSSSTGPPAATPAQLRAAVTSLLQAYDHKDASAVCADFAPDVVAWTERGAPPVIPSGSCEDWVDPAFRPQTDNSGGQSTVFQSIQLVRWYRPFPVGSTRGITAELRVVFPGRTPTSEDSQWVDFYYTRIGGRLLLAKQPPMNWVLLGPGETQMIDDLPPSTPQSAAQPVKLKPPAFPCTGAQATSPDPASDVTDRFSNSAAPVTAPWLDIRRVTGYGLATAHPCLGITLAAPVRAPLHLVVSGGSKSPFGPELVVGPDSDAEWSGLSEHAGDPIGERGSTLYVALDPTYSPWTLTGMSMCLSSPLFAEPALNQNTDPLDAWASITHASCSPD